ncbi:MAG: hypothetical protein GZ091_18820 [Paludibacter sp.]|uniref:Uncharacterized protein n=1 Tax=Flavobacterium fryxellicola TaxID=249352 RepID=A0A168AA30_9FLAO|nr:hypothetical protein [Flavobacterium fryxellicola]NDP23109.1 hypothetical protein [Paludibacter sp.]OAB31273.1 hypothetical protein FBFR_00055 [Flavobacterium fryxellicola]SHN55280.1 hypothetical protein SAMN05444395_101776 [Flavobacterium fryxellicola]
MDNNIEFKDLWRKQSISQPNIDDLQTKLKHFKKTSLRKLILTNVLLIATCFFIVFIWYYYEPQFISTKIGIVLNVAIMAIYLVVYNRLFDAYKKMDDTDSNTEYLKKLIQIKTKQKFLQSKMLSVYFIVLGIGLCLYMYEYTAMMTLFWGFFAYALIILWGGFVWLYLRPREIKKENLKIDNLIDKFQRINDQLEADL